MDVPDLITSSSSEAESECFSDEGEDTFCKLTCHLKESSWTLNAVLSDVQLDLIIQIELIAPFVFAKDYPVKKWNEWMKESNLLTGNRSSHANEDLEMEESNWSCACLFIEIYNKMSDFIPLDLKEFVIKNHNFFMELNVCNKLQEALEFMYEIEWFQKLRNSINIEERFDISTAILIISLHVAKIIIDKRDVLDDFTHYWKENEKVISIISSADEYLDQHLYTKTLNLYNEAVLLNYLIYSKRADAHRKLKNVRLAEFDKIRTFILKAAFSQNDDMPIHEMVKKINLIISFQLCKNNDDSNVDISKDQRNQSSHELSRTTANIKSDIPGVIRIIPELVSSSESNDDDAEKNKNRKYYKDRIVKTTKTSTTATKATTAATMVVTVTATATTTTVTATSNMNSSKKNLKLKENIREASYALLSKQATKAVNLYAKANKSSSQLKDEYELMQIVLLKYAYGCASAAVRTFESLMQAVAIFEDILKTHPSVTFPLIYYQIGQCYYKLNRFKHALKPLEEGLAHISDVSSSTVYYWPETTIVIEENSPEKLRLAIEELMSVCQNPPPPDVVCRYNKCGEFRKEIYFSDPDLKGFTAMKCKERCLLKYHLNCWKNLKEDLHKTNDKEFLGSLCLTPDCQSAIQEIIYLDNKGGVLRQFGASAKESPSLKSKPKKLSTVSRTEKKKSKNRKKKIIPSTIVMEVESSQQPLCRNDEESSEKQSSDVLKANTGLPECAFVDSDKVTILKKYEDEQEAILQAKYVRQREKKKEKKKLPKMMSLDEFLGDRTNEPQLLYNEYVLRLKKLQEYRNEIEIGETKQDKYNFYSLSTDHPLGRDTCDFQAFMDKQIEDKDSLQILAENIFIHFEIILKTNGPLNINDPTVTEEMCKMPLEIQDFIFASGGLLNILRKSKRFFVKDDMIYLNDVNYSKTEEIETLKGGSSMRSTLDSLDSFDVNVASGNCEIKTQVHSPLSPISTDALTEQESVEDKPKQKIENMINIIKDKINIPENRLPPCNPIQTYDEVECATAAASVSSMSNVADNVTLENEYLVMEDHKIDQQLNRNCYVNAKKKLSQSHILQKVLQFLPLFSKESKTKLLCLMLKTIVNEKTLFQYKENYAQNIDVKELEKYFVYAADVLKHASNKKTQTEFPLEEQQPKEEIKRIIDENKMLRAKMLECKLIESEMKFVQQEFNKLQKQTHEVTASLQNKDKHIQAIYQILQSSQTQSEREKEELKIKIEKLEEELKTYKSKEGDMQALTRSENNWDSRLQDIGTSSGSFVVNSFEKLIMKLQSRFPSLNRDRLKLYVQQLRSRRQNHLTGLTMEQIVNEVSLMISTEMAEKGAVPRNISAKNSLPCSSFQSITSLDNISEHENAWGQKPSQTARKSCHENANDDMCLICHEDMVKENASKLQCNHLFHSECIRVWFRQQSTCPVCRVHSLLPDEFPLLT